MTTSDAVLSSKVQVAYIDIRVFAHATEDPERVLTATRNALPIESINTVTFKKSNLTGHHGNPITLYETKIKEKKIVQAAFERLCSGLSVLDKEALANDIKQHLDKGNLYVRLDKQCAYLNELRLGSTDPVHLRIHFKKHSAEEIVDICRRSGLLP
jgi:hypothetical protein